MVLQEDEAVLLKAIENYNDKKCGEVWMIKGPNEFIPPNEVEVVENRKAIPLSENEGLYVRDLKNGRISLVRGPRTYLLGENERFWEKKIEVEIDNLIN